MNVRICETPFGRWILLHPTRIDLAWASTRWITINEQTQIPQSMARMSVYTSEDEAKLYARHFGFSFEPLKCGDKVRLTWEGRTVNAEVFMASKNGKSLVLVFEAMLVSGRDHPEISGYAAGGGGYGGTMPVLEHDDGIYRDLILGLEAKIVLL